MPMFRPYDHGAFRAMEQQLQGAADQAAKSRDAQPERDRRRGRGRATMTIAAALRSIADRLDARPGAGHEAATEPASGPC
jgi:hypothetical protein